MPDIKPLITEPVTKKSVPSGGTDAADGIVDASVVCRSLKADDPESAKACPLFGQSVPGLSFEPASDQLTSTGENVLDSVADVMESAPDLRVTVAAHTDAADDPQSALLLTRRRTIAIIRYLSDKGIDAARLRPQAFGDTQPLASGENDRVSMSVQ